MSDTDTLSAVVDTNEVAHETDVDVLLESHEYIDTVTVSDLPEGDIDIGGVGFERKAPDDYVNSLNSNRLEQQGRRIGEHYDYAYLLYGGTMAATNGDYWAQVTGTQLRASQASLDVRDNIGYDGVIRAAQSSLLIDMAVHYARKHNAARERDSEADDFVPDPAPNTAIDTDTTVVLYHGLPNVGPTLAKRMADVYPTMGALVDAVRDDHTQLCDIDQLGPVTAKQIKTQLI